MFKKSISFIIILCFFLTTIGPIPKAHADSLGLPAPGSMINLSPTYEPVIIKGLTVHKDNPFLFDFIVDVGQDKMSGEPLKKEGEKLIKYFLASLAIPDKDVWVNLSPYEKNRMIPEALGQTDMGRDLLEQDYILKQITSSLIYPEKQLGKTFWDKVYAKSQAMYGTTQIPVNTFNKVWIMADRAEVFEHNQTAFVVDQHLKVMLEEDYLALQKHSGVSVIASPKGEAISERTTKDPHTIASQIVKEIVLPELEKEVNTGKNFANLRQIFNSIILSSWYKKNLKQALLNQVYADKSKVKGIDLNDPTIKEQIYEQYLKAYKKGVFNYIKEDVVNGQTMPRKYFSGGMAPGAASEDMVTVTTDLAMGSDEVAKSVPADESRLERLSTLFDTFRGAEVGRRGALNASPAMSSRRVAGLIAAGAIANCLGGGCATTQSLLIKTNEELVQALEAATTHTVIPTGAKKLEALATLNSPPIDLLGNREVHQVRGEDLGRGQRYSGDGVRFSYVDLGHQDLTAKPTEETFEQFNKGDILAIDLSLDDSSTGQVTVELYPVVPSGSLLKHVGLAPKFYYTLYDGKGEVDTLYFGDTGQTRHILYTGLKDGRETLLLQITNPDLKVWRVAVQSGMNPSIVNGTGQTTFFNHRGDKNSKVKIHGLQLYRAAAVGENTPVVVPQHLLPGSPASPAMSARRVAKLIAAGAILNCFGSGCATRQPQPVETYDQLLSKLETLEGKTNPSGAKKIDASAILNAPPVDLLNGRQVHAVRGEDLDKGQRYNGEGVRFSYVDLGHPASKTEQSTFFQGRKGDIIVIDLSLNNSSTGEVTVELYPVQKSEGPMNGFFFGPEQYVLYDGRGEAIYFDKWGERRGQYFGKTGRAGQVVYRGLRKGRETLFFTLTDPDLKIWRIAVQHGKSPVDGYISRPYQPSTFFAHRGDPNSEVQIHGLYLYRAEAAGKNAPVVVPQRLLPGSASRAMLTFDGASVDLQGLTDASDIDTRTQITEAIIRDGDARRNAVLSAFPELEKFVSRPGAEVEDQQITQQGEVTVGTGIATDRQLFNAIHRAVGSPEIIRVVGAHLLMFHIYQIVGGHKRVIDIMTDMTKEEVESELGETIADGKLQLLMTRFIKRNQGPGIQQSEIWLKRGLKIEEVIQHLEGGCTLIRALL